MSRVFNCFFVCSIMILFSQLVYGEEKKYDSLKPYLTSSTIAVAEIDAKQFLSHEKIQNEFQIVSQYYHPHKQHLDVKKELAELYKAGELKTIYAVFDTAYLEHSFPFYVIPASQEKKKKVRETLQSFNFFMSLQQVTKTSEDVSAYEVYEDQYGVFACKQLSTVQRRNWDNDLNSVKRDDLIQVLKANRGSLISIAISPTKIQRRILEEQIPAISGKFPGIPAGMLTKEMTSIAAVLNKDLTKFELIIDTKEEKSADKVLSYIKSIYQELEKGDYSKIGSLLDRHLPPEVDGNQVKVSLGHGAESIKAISEIAQSYRRGYSELFQRKITMNRLKNIGLAMHNYHDIYASFPRKAILSKQGKPLLSWRVAILPLVEADNLYKKFHLNEPWNSDHNKKLIPLMPKIYFSPASKVNFEFKTTIQGLAGKGMFMETYEKMTYRNFRDGTSNSIMVVNTNDKNAVIWTKPVDYVPEANPFNQLTGHFSEGFYSLLADGTAWFVTKKTQPEMVHKMFTIDGGEIIKR